MPVSMTPVVVQKRHTIDIVGRRNRPSCVVAPPQPSKPKQKKHSIQPIRVREIYNKKLSLQQQQQPKLSQPKVDPRIHHKRRSIVRKSRPSRDLASKKSSALRHKHNALLVQYADKIQNIRDSGIGKFLIIIACGPSILEADLSVLKDHHKIDIMSINKPDTRVWPTKYWHFCDMTQYRRNSGIWENFNGTIINPSSIRVRHKNQILVKNITGKGWSNDLLKGYHIGRSTTFASLQLAVWMNYDKIFIFGCDMSQVNGALHYYGQNPDVDNKNRKQRFAKEATFYQFAADNLSGSKREKIFFASTYNPWPFVDKFRKLNHRTAPHEILEMAKEL